MGGLSLPGGKSFAEVVIIVVVDIAGASKDAVWQTIKAVELKVTVDKKTIVTYLLSEWEDWR